MAIADVPSRGAEQCERSDEQLLGAYRDGDRSAFSELVKQYEKELYSHLRRHLGDPKAAEDVFQETFLQVHLECARFDAEKQFRPWLYTIATNKAIDWQRRNKRHRMVSLDRSNSSADGEGPTFKDLIESRDQSEDIFLTIQELRMCVQDALRCVSQVERVVIEAVYFKSMKYREIADEQDIPLGTAKTRIHSGILKMREYCRRVDVLQRF